MTYYPINPKNPTDALGFPIRPNDYVIYFTGSSSSVYQTIARIVRINPKDKASSYYAPDGPTYTLTLEPIFDGTQTYNWVTHEVDDPNFAKLFWDHSAPKDPVTGRVPEGRKYPGVKKVVDENAKRKVVTLQRVQNVIKVGTHQAMGLERKFLDEFNNRTEGWT